MKIEFVARRVALAAMAVVLPLALAGCLAIGNRGGLEGKDLEKVTDAQNRLNSLEGRVSALEMKGDRTPPDQLKVKLDQLQEENRRLSEELTKLKRQESPANK